MTEANIRLNIYFIVSFSIKVKLSFNRYRRKRPKVDASIFGAALSHTRRSDASEKRQENSGSTFGQVSSPRLYRLRLKLSWYRVIFFKRSDFKNKFENEVEDTN